MTFTYFTDRDLGHQFPRILRNAGMVVEEHSSHFDHDTPDDEWLGVAGQRDWYVISHNKRIRYTPNERDALIRARVGAFFVIGKAPFAALAQNFVNTRRVVERFIERNPRPFIAKVYRPDPKTLARSPASPGRVELWLEGDAA